MKGYILFFIYTSSIYAQEGDIRLLSKHFNQEKILTATDIFIIPDITQPDSFNYKIDLNKITAYNCFMFGSCNHAKRILAHTPNLKYLRIETPCYQDSFYCLRYLPKLRLLDLEISTYYSFPKENIELSSLCDLKHIRSFAITLPYNTNISECIYKWKKLKKLAIYDSPKLDYELTLGGFTTHNPIRYLSLGYQYERDTLNIPFCLANWQHIRHLNFSNIDVLNTNSAISTISKIRRLDSLSWYFCNWDTIPVGLSKMQRLKYLQILYTQINEKLPEVTTFIPLIQPLKQVQHLSLSFDTTSYEHVNELLKNSKSLIFLALEGHIEGFPQKVFDCKNLESLRLYISNTKEIPKEITKLKNLQTLVLAGSFTDFPPNYIKNMPKLRYVLLINEQSEPIREKWKYKRCVIEKSNCPDKSFIEWKMK